MGGVRPRSKFVMKLKNRRCPKCGSVVNNQRTRCKKCSKALTKPKKGGAGGSW